MSTAPPPPDPASPSAPSRKGEGLGAAAAAAAIAQHQHERRRAPRANNMGQAVVYVGDEEAREQYHIENLSAGGALLTQGPLIRVGCTARVVLKLQGAAGEELPVEGRIVREVSAPEGTAGFAVVFVDLDTGVEQKLSEVVLAALADQDLGPRGKI